MSPLSIRLLGSWQTSLNDQPLIGFESDKVRALLAYLAVESDHPHRREALAGLLWPERPEYNARRCLNQALCDLRRVVGDRTASFPLLIVTRQTVQLNPASEHMLDVAAFGALLDACQQHSHSSLLDCALCLDRLQQALALYEGDFMKGFSVGDSSAFEEWAMLQREHLGQRVMETLRHLADGYERRGALEQALRYARRQVELDPWREEAQRQVMHLLAATGERGAALAQYEACRRALAAELGIEPEMGTTALYQQIRDGKAGAIIEAPFPGQPVGVGPGVRSAVVPPHNLPAALTPLIGREKELDELRQRLQDPTCRLLTIAGLGGVGKTRLALEVAGECCTSLRLGAFPDGIYVIPLAEVQSAIEIPSAVAAAIGLSPATLEDSEAVFRQRLLNHVRRKRMLLLLDSLEHLPDGVGVLTEILEQAPETKIVVTSRERLHLLGEQLLILAGLPYPQGQEAGPSEACSTPAARLFLTTAWRVCPHFEPTQEDLMGIAHICREVEGLPLAIIMAAGQMEAMSPSEIAAAIDCGLDILQIDCRDVPERQRSMRRVFDRCWALMGEQQHEALRGLSVFHGGFTGAAARQVVGVTPRELADLVSRSCLYHWPDGRFAMHSLLRQYMADKLARVPDVGRAMHERHCAYYAAVLERWGPDLRGGRQQQVLDGMEFEIDNVRAAWQWAVQERAVKHLAQMFETLRTFCQMHLCSQGEEALRQRVLDRLAREGAPSAWTALLEKQGGSGH